MGSAHRAKRRQQLAHHKALAARILDAPTADARALLAVSPPVPDVGLTRAMVVALARLGRAYAALCGHRSDTARRARRVAAALAVPLLRGMELVPHLTCTPQTAAPWPGWRADLAALRAAYPEWATGIDQDQAFLARREAELVADERMRNWIDARIAELNELLADCHWPNLRIRLNALLDELHAANRFYGGQLPNHVPLAMMSPAGHA
jgi:hypothetical protein